MLPPSISVTCEHEGASAVTARYWAYWTRDLDNALSEATEVALSSGNSTGASAGR